MTPGEREAVARATALKCCGDEAWRGTLCAYHRGWADGYDMRDEEEGSRHE